MDNWRHKRLIGERPTLPAHDKTLRCTSCGGPLTTSWQRQEGVCSKLACLGPFLQKQRAEREIRQQKRAAELVDQARAELAAQFGDSPPWNENVVLLVVPEFSNRVAPQPPERIAHLEANLREALAAAQERLKPEGAADLLQRELEHRAADQSSLVVENACTTCRGACCRHGGDHAFLVERFLAWRLANEPESTPDTIVADYLARLPSESLDYSCLYHTPTGCALPRELRSPTCNEFLCDGIVHHQDALTADPHAPSIAVSYSAGRYLRAGYAAPGQSRQERDLAPE